MWSTFHHEERLRHPIERFDGFHGEPLFEARRCRSFFILPFGFGMWLGDYKPNPKGPLNDIHKKEKTMVSQNRNLSQKLVVEERHTREYFTGNVTAEGLINAEIDTDYGARPLTPSQARFAAKALEDLADCADEKNEE